jgi:L-fuconolactonase
MFSQINLGREEPVLEPERLIIDSQHHLFIRQKMRYLYEEYLADVESGHNIKASVYVETGSFARSHGPVSQRMLGEVEFANGVGAVAAGSQLGKRKICAAIVAHADLRNRDIEEYLDNACFLAPERLRGVRQAANFHPDPQIRSLMPSQAQDKLLLDPAFRAGFRLLARRKLTFDAGVFHLQLPQLADLADAFPDVTIIINNCAPAVGLGLDEERRQILFCEWSAAIKDVARRSNVLCKICGLGLPFWGFGFDKRSDAVKYYELSKAWEPYVLTILEQFGADRCMMGSDYPPDASSAGFIPLWNALKHIVKGASETEKHALFCGTAARVYKIILPE